MSPHRERDRFGIPITGPQKEPRCLNATLRGHEPFQGVPSRSGGVLGGPHSPSSASQSSCAPGGPRAAPRARYSNGAAAESSRGGQATRRAATPASWAAGGHGGGVSAAGRGDTSGDPTVGTLTGAVAAQDARLDQRGWNRSTVEETGVGAGVPPRACDQHLHPTLGGHEGVTGDPWGWEERGQGRGGHPPPPKRSPQDRTTLGRNL